MRKLSLVFGLLLVVSCLLLVNTAFAVPRMINVQGRLTNLGVPVTAPVSLQCQIYTSRTGGSAIWPSARVDYSVTPNQEGVFNLIVGSATNPVPEFTSDNYYLGITLGSDPEEMTDRQRLVSVPFAITARNVREGTVVAGTPGTTGVVITARGRINGDVDSSSSAIYGNNEGSGPGLKGESADGIGVVGSVVGADQIGVQGENSFIDKTTGGRIYYGIGVEGEGKVGVRGFGATAGGSFEAFDNNGYGTRSYTPTTARAAVLGQMGEDTWGLLGMRTGWFSQASVSRLGEAAVVGWTRVASGHGVVGVSENNVGVYGKGATAGGSFEGTSYGVYATGEVGVYGKGATAGGDFESNGTGVRYAVRGVAGTEKGHLGYYNEYEPLGGRAYATYRAGVYGSSDSVDGVGVLAINTAGGIACELKANGGTALRINRGDIVIDSGTIKGNIKVERSLRLEIDNKPSGHALFGAGHESVVVRNTLVTADSIILITKQATTRSSRDETYYIEDRVVGESFAIKRYPYEDGGAVPIGYLIIN